MCGFHEARLAQSVEHETLNLRVVGSRPTLGETSFYSMNLIGTDGVLLTCLHVRRGILGLGDDQALKGEEQRSVS